MVGVGYGMTKRNDTKKKQEKKRKEEAKGYVKKIWDLN